MLRATGASSRRTLPVKILITVHDQCRFSYSFTDRFTFLSLIWYFSNSNSTSARSHNCCGDNLTRSSSRHLFNPSTLSKIDTETQIRRSNSVKRRCSNRITSTIAQLKIIVIRVHKPRISAYTFSRFSSIPTQAPRYWPVRRRRRLRHWHVQSSLSKVDVFFGRCWECEVAGMIIIIIMHISPTMSHLAWYESSGWRTQVFFLGRTTSNYSEWQVAGMMIIVILSSPTMSHLVWSSVNGWRTQVFFLHSTSDPILVYRWKVCSLRPRNFKLI